MGRRASQRGACHRCRCGCGNGTFLLALVGVGASSLLATLFVHQLARGSPADASGPTTSEERSAEHGPPRRASEANMEPRLVAAANAADESSKAGIAQSLEAMKKEVFARQQRAAVELRRRPMQASVGAATRAGAGVASGVATGAAASARDGAGAGAGAAVSADSGVFLRGVVPFGAGSGERPITSYVQSGGRIPMVLLAYQRSEVLRRTLTSLFEVVGFSREDVLVAQDGEDIDVTKILTEYSLTRVVHHQAPVKGERWKIGATRIARHYKWAIDAALRFFTAAPGVVIAEDDLIFAPDFLEYFHAAAPLLDYDKTLWIVSAWNDNGFAHIVLDAKRLLRTDFMPGLGWLMPRRLWTHELRAKWPSLHWDHWMRDAKQHLGREVLYPEVPRVFHNGTTGTYMEQSTHMRYFAKIAINRDSSVTWSKPLEDGPAMVDDAVLLAIYGTYDERLVDTLAAARPVKNGEDLRQSLDGSRKALTVWMRFDPEPPEPPPGQKSTKPFEPIAKFFGIWHEARRGAHCGVHELWWGSTQLLLVNTHPRTGLVKTNVRDDMKCDGFDIPAGWLERPASCDPLSKFPCCGPTGWCGATLGHCACKSCVDYRLPALGNYAHMKPAHAQVLKPSDFEGEPPQRLQPPTNLKVGL